MLHNWKIVDFLSTFFTSKKLSEKFDYISNTIIVFDKLFSGWKVDKKFLPMEWLVENTSKVICKFFGGSKNWSETLFSVNFDKFSTNFNWSKIDTFPAVLIWAKHPGIITRMEWPEQWWNFQNQGQLKTTFNLVTML